MKLDGAKRALMLIFVDSIADVKWLSAMDVVEIFAHVERYAVEHFSRGVVDELKLDVFQMLSHKLAGTEIGDPS